MQPEASFPLPNLKHLRLLKLVAEGASIGSAGKALRVSQPAATLRLVALEKHYSLPLFDRSAATISVTPPGWILYERTVRCLSHLRTAISGAQPDLSVSEIERRLHHLSISQIRALTALDAKRGFAHAARHLQLKPPSLFRSISQLETTISAKLVERTPRDAVTTLVGQDVARHFNLALDELRLAAVDIGSLEAAEDTQINIGSTRTAADFLPEAILEHSRLRPRARYRVEQAEHQEMIQALRAGRLDIMISVSGEDDADFVAEPLMRGELRILCRETHPLAAPDASDDASQLIAYGWIIGMNANGPAAATWRSVFESNGFAPPKPVLETRLWEIIKTVLLESDLLYLAVPSSQRSAMQGLTVLKRRIPGAERTLWLLQRRDWRPTRVHAEFIATIRSVACRAQSLDH